MHGVCGKWSLCAGMGCLGLALMLACQAKSNVKPSSIDAKDAERAFQQNDAGGAVAADPNGEPKFVTVQHLLVAFKGSIPKETVTRTKEEAEKLAQQLFEQAKSGANFDDLVKQHTDDSAPGIYKMANKSVSPTSLPAGTFHRTKMVAAFGDVGFPLKVGEFGLAPYDPVTSKFGWHIIKRIE